MSRRAAEPRDLSYEGKNHTELNQVSIKIPMTDPENPDLYFKLDLPNLIE